MAGMPVGVVGLGNMGSVLAGLPDVRHRWAHGVPAPGRRADQPEQFLPFS